MNRSSYRSMQSATVLPLTASMVRGMVFPEGETASEPAPPEVILKQSLFDRDTQTGMVSAGDSDPLTCGVLLRSMVSGTVTMIWFFKTALDTATSRTVGLYDMFNVSLLGTGTSIAEPAGPAWVGVPLDTPVKVNPMRRIIAAVLFPNGNYAAQAGAFATAKQSGFLEAMADSDPLSGPGNGRYQPGATLALPTENFGEANYWIDIEIEIPQWPNAESTGVPAGTVLTPVSGTITLTENDTIFEDKILTGNLVIAASRCIVRRCKFISGTPYHIIYVQSGENNVFEDNEIDGLGSSVNGVLGNGSFWRNHIHGVENGINLTAPSDVRDNYLHSFDNTPSGDPHFDGIEVDGGGGHNVIHNTILLSHGQTAALMFNNEFDGLTEIEVSHNYIAGGGYTVYVDDRKSAVNVVDAATIKIHDNRMGSGIFGYFAIWGENFPPPVAPYGNYDATTGLPID